MIFELTSLWCLRGWTLTWIYFVARKCDHIEDVISVRQEQIPSVMRTIMFSDWQHHRYIVLRKPYREVIYVIASWKTRPRELRRQWIYVYWKRPGWFLDYWNYKKGRSHEYCFFSLFAYLLVLPYPYFNSGSLTEQALMMQALEPLLTSWCELANKN